MADEKTYRHRLTGLIQRLSPRVAVADPNLVEVADDAKPLAYTPIPREAVQNHLASKAKEK